MIRVILGFEKCNGNKKKNALGIECLTVRITFFIYFFFLVRVTGYRLKINITRKHNIHRVLLFTVTFGLNGFLVV